jgi:hypothetical protein
MYSKLHQSFFTSLGIPLPANANLCRPWVWPILTRKKGPQKEVLLHSRNQTFPNLPIGMKITRDGGEDRFSKSAMEELIQHRAIGLEENVLRHKLLLKDQFSLKWSWQEEPSRGRIECTIFAHIPIGSKSRQHTEQKAPTLEISRINLKHEQRNIIHCPSPQPPFKARSGRGRTLSS